MGKLVFITENIEPPYDEGIKKSVYYFYSQIKNLTSVDVICRKGFSESNIHIINTNKLFLSLKLKKILNEFNPKILIYLPFSSNTFASHLRIFILKKLFPMAKSVFIILQPKPYKKWNKFLVKFFLPDLVISTSLNFLEIIKKYGVSTKLILPFTDLSKFKVVNETKKILLRKKYNIPLDKFVISHIGHINWGRNLEALLDLQIKDNQVIIVGSSSTPEDAPKEENLKKKLIENGIIVFDGFIKNIEEIYQLSDLYIFPVTYHGGSIDFPLSILEARACGIPVLTTNFGSVKIHLDSDNGAIMYSSPDKFSQVVEKLKMNYEKEKYQNIENIKIINDNFMNTIKELI